MSRPTADIAHWTYPTHAGGKSIEQLSIERLVLQLIEDASDVFVRYQVVAGLTILRLPSVHVCGDGYYRLITLSFDGFLRFAPATMMALARSVHFGFHQDRPGAPNQRSNLLAPGSE
jgi:hypothetical protein